MNGRHCRQSALLLLVTMVLTRWAVAQDLGPAPLLPASERVFQLRQLAEVNVPAIDTSSRLAVVAAFYSAYNASEGFAVGWDGNTANCVLGVNSTNHKEATLRRVNYFRAMAGLPGVVALDDTRSTKCIRAAMMMSAHGGLSHNPPGTWTCYSADGAEAAGKSNLALGREGPGAVDLYMDDHGPGNEPVGHRRWILYPPQVVMGTGSVPAQSGKSSANALWVLAQPFGARPPSPEFVAWPSPGFFPYQLLPRFSSRWSFSRPNASFGGTTVSVTQNGTPLTVNIVSTADNGYGDNTLVWTVAGVPTSAPTADRSYEVTLSNVLIDGSSRSFSYTVTVIDPAVPNLEARFALDAVTIAWPAGPTGFLLQTGAVSGAGVTWGNANLSPAPVGNEHHVTITPAEGTQLFRLRK
jgi:uncharacterized protein YkwD